MTFSAPAGLGVPDQLRLARSPPAIQPRVGGASTALGTDATDQPDDARGNRGFRCAATPRCGTGVMVQPELSCCGADPGCLRPDPERTRTERCQPRRHRCPTASDLAG